MQLRDYQLQAVQQTLSALRCGAHPVVACATGGGKSIILAELCKQLPDARILIATHRKELLRQNEGTLLAVDADADLGIYSAGLQSFATDARIILGGIQSIYRHMERLQASASFQYIIVDEAHLCTPADAEAKMYNAVFAACPTAQRIGLSATPFRLTEGVIYGPPPCWFDVVACDIGIRQLTPEYLAPLRGVLTAHDVPTTGVRTSRGDFVVGDLSQLACEDTLIEGACDEMCFLAAKRKKWLVFGVDVAHVARLTDCLMERGVDARMATGKTPSDERAALIQGFRHGEFRALVNCNLYTTGMDVPDIDAIVLVRPTQSQGLLIQQLGRGTRQAEGKKDCVAEGSLVLTDKGLIPIEEISHSHRVWDGLHFSTHDGAVCHGEHNVVTYAGLTATPDHLVWTQEGWRTIGDCARQQISIAQTGYGREAIRESDRYFTRSAVDASVRIRLGPVWMIVQSIVSHLFFGGNGFCVNAKALARQQILSVAWITIRGSDPRSCGALAPAECHIPRDRTPLLPTIQQTKRRVWDILNAGPFHRFTVQGLLVHNCVVIDLAGNLSRHVPLDAIHDYHKSPERVAQEAIEAKRKAQRRIAHETEASSLEPMEGGTPAMAIPVDAVSYEVMHSRNPTQRGKTLLVVTYRLRSPIHRWARQWVCLEYSGGARFYAEQWFARRQAPMPSTAAEALWRAHHREYPMPEAVILKQDGKYLRVLVEHFAPTERMQHVEESGSRASPKNVLADGRGSRPACESGCA